MDAIARNLTTIQETIAAACDRANRDPAGVTLVAVSKLRSPEAVLAAADAGVQHFGENRVEEAQEKLPKIADLIDDQAAAYDLTWHMVGHIQSRKARHVPVLFDMVHSVDNIKLAEKLSRLASARQPLDVLLQMNVSGEESKSGFPAANWRTDTDVRDQLLSRTKFILKLPGLRVRGLMTMAPIVTDMEQTRPVFASLAALRDDLSQSLGIALPELSMGMTDDYPVAVEEGATMVRIGRALFDESMA
jgi:pyridoxal phosphate enzyme (YggS family)